MLVGMGTDGLGIGIVRQLYCRAIAGPEPVSFESSDRGCFVNLLDQQGEKIFKEFYFEFSSRFAESYFGRRGKRKGIKVLIEFYLQAFFKRERIKRKVVEKSNLRLREKSCARMVQAAGLKEVFCRNPFRSLKMDRWKLLIKVRCR